MIKPTIQEVWPMIWPLFLCFSSLLFPFFSAESRSACRALVRSSLPTDGPPQETAGNACKYTLPCTIMLAQTMLSHTDHNHARTVAQLPHGPAHAHREPDTPGPVLQANPTDFPIPPDHHPSPRVWG